MGIVLDVLPGAISPEAGLEKVEYAAFLYLQRLFLVGILGNLFALPVLGRAEPLEHPASGHGLEDGVQAGRIYPPPSVTQVRHQLREILENLTHTLLSGPLLPWEVEGVIIHLAQVLSLLVGIVAAQFQPHGHEPFAELLAVAQEMKMRMVGVPPRIRNRTAVCVPLPSSELHFLVFLAILVLNPLGLQVNQEGVIMVGTLRFADAYDTALLDVPLELLHLADLRPDGSVPLQFFLQLLAWHIPHRQRQEP